MHSRMVNDYGGDKSVQDFRRSSRDDKNWDEEEYRSPYLANDGLEGSEEDEGRDDGTEDDDDREGEEDEEDEYESDIERTVYSRLASDSFLTARSTSEMFDEHSLSSISPDDEEEDDHDSHRRGRGSLDADNKRLGGCVCMFSSPE